MKFGQIIRDVRQRSGVTQSFLARRVGMSAGQLNSRERGAVPMSQAEFMGAVAALRGMVNDLDVALADIELASVPAPEGE